MTASEDELERQLRTLFADDRLHIQPETNAEQAILAGAGRRRRRRQVVLSGTTVAAAAVLVVGGLTVVKVQARDNNAAMTADQLRVSSANSSAPVDPSVAPAPESAPPQLGTDAPAPTSGGADESTRVVPKSPQTNAPAPANKVQTGPVLSAYGYGQLKLGMTEADVSAQGITLAKRESGEPCTYYDFSGSGVPAAGSLAMSPGNGLVIVIPAMPAHTPEGIGVGSTKEDVLATYPGASDAASTVAAPAGPTSTYRFALSPQETVERVDLYSVSQDCVG